MPNDSLFYDLCISESLLELQTQKERVSIALSYGYDGVAVPHQASARLTATDKCSIRSLLVEELLAAAKGLSGSYEASSTEAQLPVHGNPYRAVQLTRLNLPVEDSNVAQESLSNASGVAQSYDLVAAQPQNERAFMFACTTMDVDLISLDLSRRLSFRFKPDAIQAAVKRGVQFEVLYAPLLRDAASRKQMFANVQALARETRGRAIVLSSGARSASELRGPHDIANLGTFLGLTEQQARAAISTNVDAVLKHAKKRRAFRGLLTIRPLDSQKDSGLLAPVVGDTEAQAMETDGNLRFAGSKHVQ